MHLDLAIRLAPLPLPDAARLPWQLGADARCGLMIAPQDLASARERLRHIYWIGGGSGAGKSTIARRLAARHGFRLYSTDDAMADHARRCAPDDCPMLAKFQAMSMDERWVNRTPEVMLETFHWFCGEGFQLIVEDLLNRPTDRGIVAEGFRLLPRLVKPLLSSSARAVWLIPTPTFRVAAFENRGTLWSIASKTSAPERALRNLLERDRLFTARLQREAEAAAADVISVDTSLSENTLEKRVAEHFGL